MSLFFLFTIALTGCTHTADEIFPPAQQQQIGSLSFRTERAADRSYLGITHNDPSVSFAAIKADIIIIQIFSMYCPICQKDAPQTCTLFEKIQKKGLSGRIKMIGIGIGNSPFEVQLFKKKYEIPFPLCADPDASLSHALGSRGTPQYIIAQRTPDGNVRIVYNKREKLNPTAFLQQVIALLP